MKKSLISAAVLAALSSTQVNADGQNYSNGKFRVPCISVDEASEDIFYNAGLEIEEKSGKFQLLKLSQESDDSCKQSAKLLKGIGFDEDDSMDDDGSIDEDDSVDDDDSMDEDDSMDDDGSIDEGDSMDDDGSIDEDDSMDEDDSKG